MKFPGCKPCSLKERPGLIHYNIWDLTGFIKASYNRKGSSITGSCQSSGITVGKHLHFLFADFKDFKAFISKSVIYLEVFLFNSFSFLNNVFSDYIDEFVVVYLDDIVVYSESLEEHVVHLPKAMEKLHINKLFLKLA